MPQMMPMNWNFIYVMCFFMLCVFLCYVFFYVNLNFKMNKIIVNNDFKNKFFKF